MSFKNKGVIDSTKHVIDLRPFKAEPVIINNEIYLLYSRVLLKAKYEN